MGEFDEAFNAETFQQLHLKILQERDGQWMVGEGGEAKGGVGSFPTRRANSSLLIRLTGEDSNLPEP